MKEENVIPPTDVGTQSNVVKAFRTVLVAGLVVGILDCIAATISSAMRGVTFVQVWQYVASGLLGNSSYQYGAASVALGLVIHFFIAFSVTAIYVFSSRRLPKLIEHAVLFGALYGVIVYFVMGHVVSPMSAAARLPFSSSGMLTGIFIHIVCVGLPIALINRYFENANSFNNHR